MPDYAPILPTQTVMSDLVPLPEHSRQLSQFGQLAKLAGNAESRRQCGQGRLSTRQPQIHEGGLTGFARLTSFSINREGPGFIDNVFGDNVVSHKAYQIGDDYFVAAIAVS